jgi:nitroimidazol reductase NimA-like FMN-containing flavoprotein (pyridoxamine 5'-phosphate oxidase superfamily)
MPPLTKQALQEFLYKGNIAKIATIDENGLPYINPVWYEWDGKSFYIIARAKSKFLSNVRKNSSAAVCVDVSTPPYTRVTAQGKASILSKFDWVSMGKRMTLKYLGEKGLASYLDGTLKLERAVIRIDPTSIQSWTGMDWHPRYTS